MPSRLPFRSFQARHPALPPTFDLSPARQTLRFVTEHGAFIDEGVRDLGSAFSIDMIGYGPLVVFSDEETVKRITSARPEDFTHANDIVAFFVGQRSIFLLDGEPHKHARRRTLSAFAGDRMRRYGEVMKVAADRYIDTLGPDQTISAMEAGTTMALEIILVALFGLESGPLYERLSRDERADASAGPGEPDPSATGPSARGSSAPCGRPRPSRAPPGSPRPPAPPGRPGTARRTSRS